MASIYAAALQPGIENDMGLVLFSEYRQC